MCASYEAVVYSCFFPVEKWIRKSKTDDFIKQYFLVIDLFLLLYFSIALDFSTIFSARLCFCNKIIIIRIQKTHHVPITVEGAVNAVKEM